MTTTTTPIIVGEGVLTWPRNERVSDRYGLVGLMGEGNRHADLIAQGLTEQDAAARVYLGTDPTSWSDVHTVPEGARGRLQARVVRTRQSGHIGDLFRGLSPSTPEVGDLIVLGDGTVFWETVDGDPFIGLEPDDGRDSDWLDPEALYRAHEQTVELQFIPEEQP